MEERHILGRVQRKELTVNAKIIVGPLPLLVLLTACSPGQMSPATADDETPETTRSSAPIERKEIEAAQAKWCAALIEIGKAGAGGGDAKAVAGQVLSSAYDYDSGTVLFKPTLTFGERTFRMTKPGALAYFVGGDPDFPDDKGFALKPWTKCRSEIAGVVENGDMAIAMGNVYLEAANGDKVMVDKTFGYRRTADGALKIVLHHSSLPYTPAK
ncbi:MAG: hypothetical protein JNK04_25885 [Myxococcales bacterium]|nr:hypothetical protein [Myxococcales bacterium]